ncbi:MAG TPA: PAS-domain containing protein, partial [Rhizomicrobium sp.]
PITNPQRVAHRLLALAGGIALGLAKAQNVRAPVEEAPEAVSPALLEALDCLRTAITMYDAGERLIYANQHFDYLYRTLPARDELLGRSYGEIVRLETAEIAPGALAGGVEAFVARRRAQLTDGDFQPLDVPLADGRILEIKSRRTPDGGWIALWSDVTAARAALGRLSTAIELSADAFAFFDGRDRLVVCNREYAALHGSGVEAMRGLEFSALMERAVADGRVRIEGDRNLWLARRLDLHNASTGAMTLEMASGAAYLVRDRKTRDGHVTVLTDVTDERRTEAALSQTKAELASQQDKAAQQASYLADLTRRLDAAAQGADSAKKTLLRTMSHELKTPLNAIIGFSDLLGQMAERFGPGQVREYAGLIHAGGHNLLRLINQILDLTKLAAGRFEPRLARLDIGGALWLAKDAFGERAAAKSLAIDAEGCPLGLIAEVDENSFGQMVMQLLDNAVAFTPEGGTITLAASREAGRIRFTVADDGPGVKADDLARIVAPFEQAGRSTTDHTHGAGLGLTLVKAFAELHGGSLSLASAPGAGFAATVELPTA